MHKELIQQRYLIMRKLSTLSIIVTFLLLALSSCGGGGSDGGSNSPSAVDATPPSLSVSASLTTAYSGDVVSLTINASDASGSVNTTVSCDGGSYSDGNLTLPIVDASITVTCEVAATDPSRNQSSRTITIDVEPREILLIEAFQESELKSGAMLALSTRDYNLANRSGNITINGVGYPFTADATGIVLFIVPRLDAGNYRIELPLGQEQTGYYEFTVISSAVAPEIAQNFVLTDIADTLVEIDNYLQLNQGQISATEQAYFNDAMAAYNNLTQADLGGITYEEWLYIASYLEANDPEQTTSKVLQVNQYSSSCNTNLLQAKAVIAAGTAVGAVLSFQGSLTATGTIVGAPAGVVLGLIGAGFAGTSLGVIGSFYDDIKANCLKWENFTLTASGNMQVKAKSIHHKQLLNAATTFSHNQYASFVVEADQSIIDALRARIATAISSFKSIQAKESYLPDFIFNPVDRLVKLIEPTTEYYPTANMTFSDTSDDGVDSNANVGVTAVSEGEFGVSVRAAILDFSEVAEEPFTLHAIDSIQGVNESLAASVSILPPVAQNVAYIVAGGGSITEAMLAEYATSYQVVLQPSDGTLTHEPEVTAYFTYTPDVEFFGTDSFTYKAINGAGDSNIATVTIEVTDNSCRTTLFEDNGWSVNCGAAINEHISWDSNGSSNGDARLFDLSIQKINDRYQDSEGIEVDSEITTYLVELDNNLLNENSTYIDSWLEFKRDSNLSELPDGSKVQFRNADVYIAIDQGDVYRISLEKSTSFIDWDNRTFTVNECSWISNGQFQGGTRRQGTFANGVYSSQSTNVTNSANCPTVADAEAVNTVTLEDSVIYQCLVIGKAGPSCPLAP